MYHNYDAVVIGGGGAGLMAATQISPAGSTAVLSKLHPMRSHTGAAQGGIGAALGNLEEDLWEWHMFDTVKGGDYLVDQDAAEILAQDAIEAIYELEHWGLPFDRTDDGKIAQRPFGGHTCNYGEGIVRRACYTADRTGHAILQTLYQRAIRNRVDFFDEFQVVDICIEAGACQGVVAYEVATGELHIFRAKTVLIATGGCGRLFRITSNAYSFTGDGHAMAFRKGVPLEDMEFFQFHPTGIYKLGILITEAVRGEGGILLNKDGERFMERYSPNLLDLAPRDVVARAIHTEVAEGRGIDGKDYVHLDASHLGREAVEKKLPDIQDFCGTYLGIDPAVEPMPVQPTAHYAMGGIPTNVDGQVLMDEKGTVLHGVYAAGECACVSVHGANRLGSNSLLELVVFGRRAGRHMAKHLTETDFLEVKPDPRERVKEELARLYEGDGTEEVATIRSEMRDVMMNNVGVFREQKRIDEAVEKVRELRNRYGKIRVQNRSNLFNQELLEALELGYLLELAEVAAMSAAARKESRGAHSRADYPDRDDDNWLKHTMAFRTERGVELRYKPVNISFFDPKPRTF